MMAGDSNVKFTLEMMKGLCIEPVLRAPQTLPIQQETMSVPEPQLVLTYTTINVTIRLGNSELLHRRVRNVNH